MKYLICLLFLFLNACDLNKKAEFNPDKFLAETAPKVIPPELGRYQIVQLGTMRRDQFLLDTVTGSLWSRTCWVSSKKDSSSCGMDVWESELIEGLPWTREQLEQMRKSTVTGKSK